MTFDKKLSAFTLAEVLVTLAIIGVVASLTIPSLIKSYQEIAWKAAWKKEFSLLSQATKMIEADNGGTLLGVFSSVGQYGNYLKYVKSCTRYPWECWHQNGTTKQLNGTSQDVPAICEWCSRTYILSDGAFLYQYVISPGCNGEAWQYGIDICTLLRVDVNGSKGPNTFGKDIFGAFVTRTGLKPMGAAGDVYSPSTSCIEGSTESSNNGWGCSAKYLHQ